MNTKVGQVANDRAGILIALLLTAISFSVFIALLYKEQLLLVMDEALYTRLLPIAILGALISLQAGMLFMIPHVNKDSWADVFSPVWKPPLFTLGGFLAVWAFMSMTHLGFIFDDVGLSWGPPGTPVTFAQVCLVFMVGVLLAFAHSIFKSKMRSQHIPIRDIIIFVVLWGLAVTLWWGEPVSEMHFNPPLTEPHWEYYPNSDAMIFDRSSNHLIFGTGFSNQLIRRPLYAGMLALFHKLGGFGYENTIFLQILVLAFIPPLTYLLASRLSNRLAGLIAGGLILLRESDLTAIADLPLETYLQIRRMAEQVDPGAECHIHRMKCDMIPEFFELHEELLTEHRETVATLDKVTHILARTEAPRGGTRAREGDAARSAAVSGGREPGR